MKIFAPFTLLASLISPAAFAAPPCADLAGTWSGLCYNDHGPGTAKSLVVTQSGCREISFNGWQHQIPSTYTVTEPRAETHSLQWDANGTTLIDRGTFSQDLGDGNLIQGTVERNMSLDGTTLQVTDVMKAVLRDWQGHESPLEATTTCSYAR